MTYEQALSRTAALCSGAEYCERQIEEKLRRWEMEEADITRILQYLKDEKYIDSERFCRAFTSDKVRYNHWGRMKIRQALRFQHLPDEAISEALDQIDDSEYQEVLSQILAAKSRTLHDSDPYVRRAKLLRHAASKGFEADLVLSLLPEE